MIYERYANTKSTWLSISGNNDNLYEWVSEEIILNCPLFEVEYEPEPKIWRAEKNKQFAFIDNRNYSDITIDLQSVHHTRMHELGNYFHPQDDADEIKQVRKDIAEVFARSKARRAK